MTDIFVFGSNTAGRHGKGAALEDSREEIKLMALSSNERVVSCVLVPSNGLDPAYLVAVTNFGAAWALNLGAEAAEWKRLIAAAAACFRFEAV